ncbi:polysaccharide lyase 6 family protein [Steroidobacter sp. S1-65]|uniref:Polysaccharide lyase 6 family protein n=1 Tax=Steroidobacter gossypii TaxID=2805490 RepID=A0ABS1X4C3_9GAMM|nr:polysaccharide lyase 6 family protein [Steroidobacter gossypii]MBM0108086.1 polysaccharide lyase 6 family protein [Steroidobacter gossypii]
MTGIRECRLALLVVAAVIGCTSAAAKEIRVSDQAAYARAVKQVKPGDVIELADGEWRDFKILFEGQGTAAQPITLTAQTKGKVFVTGQSNLRLAGEYLVVSGLVFRDGHTPTDEVISFRRDSKRVARHSRVTEVVIDAFNPSDRRRQDHWVSLYGQANRVDHSQFVGKTNAGVTLAVIRDAPVEDRHRIDHNYFGFRPPLGSNGGETLRIGTSEQSLSASRSVVERNYFEHCDGEVEIVSNKSGGNSFLGNTFFESQGSLVLRHGNDNLVEGNVFFGNGRPHTGGIRVINARQTIRGNYMEGVAGTGFASAFAVMNGVPNSVINRYHQVAGARIENNTIVDAARITLGAGADAERSAPPVDSKFERNLIVGRTEQDPFLVETELSGVSFAGNVQSEVAKPALSAGFTRRAIELARGENGLLYPKDPALAQVGAPRSLVPVRKEETGVAWYSKPSKGGVDFSVEETHRVTSSAELTGALAAAMNGDTIQLAAGEYVVDAPLMVDRALTIAGSQRATTIRFKQASLFVLRRGGALRLQGLRISGAAAPAQPGNVVIKLDEKNAPAHYAVEILDSEFVDLNRAAGFDVIAVSPRFFGQRLAIRDSAFTDVSGAVLAVTVREGGDPLYALETIEISNTSFNRVGRVADVFRGGRDESTFGPRFTLTNSTIADSGKDEGNSLRLSGVLFTHIAGNRFSDSGRIEITHGVGAPQTAIVDNRFADTPAPVIRELYAKGPPRVALERNVTGGAK